ncbi:MAG: hypothetical protein FWC65_01855 [Treponema sp.]|nr:hypothetical protein [Treponema sp.]
MKKIIFTMLFASAVLFFSCQENGEPRAPQAHAENEPEAAAGALNVGYALRVNTSLMRVQGEDTGDQTTRVVWADQMSLGERVLIGETRQLTNHTSGNVYAFIEVRRDNGNTGFSWATQVVPGGNLAVVVDDRAFLYRAPRPVEVSGTILSRMSVVVYYPETESGGFVQVRGWDHGRGANIALANNHIRRTSLSMNHSDVQSAILLQTALAPNQAARREALLEAALLYVDSVFFTEVFETLHPPAAGVEAAGTAADIESPAEDADFFYDDDFDFDQLDQ